MYNPASKNVMPTQKRPVEARQGDEGTHNPSTWAAEVGDSLAGDYVIHREFKASSVRPFFKTMTTTSSWVLAAVVHSFRPGPQAVSLRLAWST